MAKEPPLPPFSDAEKNNMVSNDSKLPDSARNALIFLGGGGGKRWQRRFRRLFLKLLKI
jgi:hypothetical protein